MPNRHTDPLFQLIKSLEKSEKRNFKLYANRNSSSEELKAVLLFDALDKMETYNDELLLKKNKYIKKQQLSNMKAHLYKQLLNSLRLIRNDNHIDIQLHELMDHARILYGKGLYLQALKVLDKLKEVAEKHNQLTYLQQAVFFEKNIESLFITRSSKDKAEVLAQASDKVNSELLLISKLSNLALLLYSWYIKNGHARNEKDEKELQLLWQHHFPESVDKATSFYEKMYLFQCYCWDAFIKQDFLQYYRYTQKWVNLFDENPLMKDTETGHYIKGMHNLLSAHFDLQNYKKMDETIQHFETFLDSKTVALNDSNRIQTFLYLSIAKVNRHFMMGTFSEGLKLIPDFEARLKKYDAYIDRHRVLVLYYKIACLYFGSGNNDKAIDYLNKIINFKHNLRTDLQCYARLLHLIAHYELGNYDLLEYLIKSVYRFMAKMENLSLVEEEMFKFLRNAMKYTPRTIKPAFEKLLNKLKQLKVNRYETRAFAYLDVISWLESKIENVAVQDVIHRKYMTSLKPIRN